MPLLELGPHDGLYYEFDSPSQDGAPTFVFVNPITGDTAPWQLEIGPALRDAGFGTLAYNFRGQANSPYSPGTSLDEKLISGDLKHIVKTLEIARPLLVGLSIGGLFAIRAHLAGLDCAGLVLVNTLRIIGPRLAWISDAILKVMDVGGPQLMGDMMTPLLWGPDWLAANRQDFIQPGTDYAPLDPDSGPYNLLTHMGQADWDVPYEEIRCPVLVMMGPNDRIFYEAAVIEQLMKRIPDARRTDVPTAGHMLPMEAPAEFIAAAKDFGAAL